MDLNSIQTNIQAGPAAHLVADQGNDLPPDKSLLERFCDLLIEPSVIGLAIGAALIIAGAVCFATGHGFIAFGLLIAALVVMGASAPRTLAE